MAPFRTVVVALAAMLALPAASLAQTYPSRPVKLVVAFAAGGPIDIAARTLAEALTGRLGQSFIVENRPGANGAIAAEAVKSSPPDGHTVLISNASMITITPTLVKDLRYDVARDFAPVTRLVASPMVLVVNPENPVTAGVRTVADLVAAAKRAPGQISYGSAGLNGNVQQLAFELMADQAGISLLGVPFKGSSEVQLAVLSQTVALSFDTLTAVPHIRSGKLRPLAVSTRAPVRDLPDVPTMESLGFKQFDIGFWSGVFVPKGTPEPVVQQLNRAIQDAVQEPAVRTKLETLGTVVTSTPEAFRQHIETETTTYTDVIRRAKLTPQ